MALKYFNIRSGETLLAETEPQIAALWSSSDKSPNISQGQDFGWRLAPAIAVKLKQYKQDLTVLQTIASRIGRPLEDVSEPDILGYISAQSTPETAPVANQDDYQDAYDQEIRKLSGEEVEKEETLEELEARVAAKRAALGVTTTTTVAPETTTTTTQALETTTTTTVTPPLV